MDKEKFIAGLKAARTDYKETRIRDLELAEQSGDLSRGTIYRHVLKSQETLLSYIIKAAENS